MDTGDITEFEVLIKDAIAGDHTYFESLGDSHLANCLYALDPQGRSLYHHAATSPNFQVVELLARADWKNYFIDIRDKDGWAPIHYACTRLGSRENVHCLLLNGAYVNMETHKNETALHFAAANGSVQIAEMLLAYGAKIDAADQDKDTPLHLAARSGNTELCQMLLNVGAEIYARNNKGQTVLEVANILGQKEVVTLLESREEELMGLSTLSR